MNTKNDVLRNFCYEPIAWKRSLGYGVAKGPKDCRASVHEEGRGVGFHQCGRIANQTVEGRRFCGLHAERLRNELEAADARRPR